MVSNIRRWFISDGGLMSNFDGAFPFVWWEPLGRFDGGFPLGGPTAPRVSSAILLTCRRLQVLFNVEVKHTNPSAADDSLNLSNYVFSGPTILEIDGITLIQASPTIVELAIFGGDGIEAGIGNYTVTVANVKSLSNSNLDPLYTSAIFDGLTCSGVAKNWVAEILIDGNVVWSANNSLPQQSVILSVQQFTGILPLAFRIRGLP